MNIADFPLPQYLARSVRWNEGPYFKKMASPSAGSPLRRIRGYSKIRVSYGGFRSWQIPYHRFGGLDFRERTHSTVSPRFGVCFLIPEIPFVLWGSRKLGALRANPECLRSSKGPKGLDQGRDSFFNIGLKLILPIFTRGKTRVGIEVNNALDSSAKH